MEQIGWAGHYENRKRSGIRRSVKPCERSSLAVERKFRRTMEKLKDYILLHLNIMLFSFTSVFSKLASQQFNKHRTVFSRNDWIFFFDVIKLLCLCNCVAEGYQKI